MLPSASSTPLPYGLEVLRTYGDGFAGREEELAALDRAWNDGIVRVFVLHAEGGAGKTRVVARWLTQMRDDGWRGAGRVFVHSFYSQGSDEQRNASSEIFFEQALNYFGHPGPRLTDPTEQGRTLARLIVEQRGLLVLDGLEPLQHPPSFDQGRLKDPAIALLAPLPGWRTDRRSFQPDDGRSMLGHLASANRGVSEQDRPGCRTAAAGPAGCGGRSEITEAVGGPGTRAEVAPSGGGFPRPRLFADASGTYLRDATDDHEIRRRHEIPLLAEDAEHQYHARHLFGVYVRHLGESSPEVAVLRLLASSTGRPRRD